MREPTNTLSATLRQLRKAAKLSGTEAARRAGLSQSKVSRAEIGSFMPTPEQVEALCQVYRAPEDVRDSLVAMAQELRADPVSARAVLEQGGWLLQERIGRIEQAADRVRGMCPSVVPGILQTAEYIGALFGNSLAAADLERTIETRLNRQDLLNTDREFVFVLGEGALRWNMGGATVMAHQLTELVAYSRRPNVHIGIVAWTTPVTMPLMHSFTIYDSRAVLFGTIGATALVTEPADVTEYENYWSELEPFVTYGDAARTRIEQAADDYRGIS